MKRITPIIDKYLSIIVYVIYGASLEFFSHATYAEAIYVIISNGVIVIVGTVFILYTIGVDLRRKYGRAK